eukprot:UN04588
MKVRDGSLKLTQSLFKLTALNIDDKQTTADFEKAAGVIGMGRRLIRFGRWVPFVSNLTKNLFSTELPLTVTKAIHHLSCIMGCLAEDLTTLDKLNVLKLNGNAQFFEHLQKYSTFTEAISGVVLSFLLLKGEKKRFRDLCKGYEKNPANAEIKKSVFVSFYNIHTYQNNIAKWTLEIISQSANLPTPLHSSTNLSIIAAILSASNGLYLALLKAIMAQGCVKK